jgi:hypothetical protein
MHNSNEGPAPKRPKTHHDLKDTLVLRPHDTAPRAGWNSLPAELRLEIYSYLIPRFEHPINVSNPKFKNRFFFEYNDSIAASLSEVEEGKYWSNVLPWTKILLINKQISYECLDILYGKNSFQIEMHKTGEADLRNKFTRENRERMRYITVAFLGTEGATFPPGNSIPDYDLWYDLLPNVKELWLVMLQPFRPPPLDMVRPGDEFWVSKLWDRFDQYLEWLPPYLECFYAFLPYGTGINIMSDHDTEEVKELVMEYLTSRYRVYAEYALPALSAPEGNEGDGTTRS